MKVIFLAEQMAPSLLRVLLPELATLFWILTLPMITPFDHWLYDVIRYISIVWAFAWMTFAVLVNTIAVIVAIVLLYRHSVFLRKNARYWIAASLGKMIAMATLAMMGFLVLFALYCASVYHAAQLGWMFYRYMYSMALTITMIGGCAYLLYEYANKACFIPLSMRAYPLRSERIGLLFYYALGFEKARDSAYRLAMTLGKVRELEKSGLFPYLFRVRVASQSLRKSINNGCVLSTVVSEKRNIGHGCSEILYASASKRTSITTIKPILSKWLLGSMELKIPSEYLTAFYVHCKSSGQLDYGSGLPLYISFDPSPCRTWFSRKLDQQLDPSDDLPDVVIPDVISATDHVLLPTNTVPSATSISIQTGKGGSKDEEEH